MPFLSRLAMNPGFILSGRAIKSLAGREGAANIRSLTGISYVFSPSFTMADDHLVQLLRFCENLEELEIIGQGLDPAEQEFSLHAMEVPAQQDFLPLNLPHLRIITLLSMYSSPVMLALLLSPLRSLRKLTITPYDDIPYPTSHVSQFISTHGECLNSLLLFTPKSWPTRLHPSPHTLLESAPHLRHLSLESPLPSRIILNGPHPLQILSVPRPNPESWDMLERLIPNLPALCVVRARDVRWLRKGMTVKAQEAGVQGEMREWRRRLSRRGIRVVDTEWKDSE